MKTQRISTIFLLGCLLVLSTNLFGQRMKVYQNPQYGPDSASRMQCAMNLSIMSEYVKIGSYDLALDSWRKCFKECPEASKNIYISGSKIIKHKIENATDEEIQSAWVDTLMLLYDQRITYFEEEGRVNGYKGIDLLRYRKSDAEKAYGFLEKSVDLREEDVSESVAITFISTTYALMQKDILGPDVMITNYVKIMDLLEEKLAKGRRVPKIEQAIENVEKVFAESGAADCESLIAIFTPKFEEDPDDLDQLKKITALLTQTECEESDLYAKAAEAQYALEPSAEAAANLAVVFAVRDELDKSVEYYNKAISQETDSEKKAEYYFFLGKIALQKGGYSEARRNAREALALKSNYGEAYILIGDAYASSSKTCGESDFEQQTVYWAAVDKFQKAKAVDPSVTEKATEKINLYSGYFPNNETTFFNGYTDGQTYKVGCWIQENTVVRTTR